MTASKKPVKKALPKEKPVSDFVTRLEEVEKKVNFIYAHIVKQAVAQVGPQLEQRIMDQLMEGAIQHGTGNSEA